MFIPPSRGLDPSRGTILNKVLSIFVGDRPIPLGKLFHTDLKEDLEFVRCERRRSCQALQQWYYLNISKLTALGYQHVFSSMNQAVRRQAVRRPPRWADPAGKRKGRGAVAQHRSLTNPLLSLLKGKTHWTTMIEQQLLSNWVFSMVFILSSFSIVHCSTTNVLQNSRCKLDATRVTYDSAVSSSSLCHRGDCGSVPAPLLWFGVSGLCSWCTLRLWVYF